jgi:hypothetical protein
VQRSGLPFALRGLIKYKQWDLTNHDGGGRATSGASSSHKQTRVRKKGTTGEQKNARVFGSTGTLPNQLIFLLRVERANWCVPR